MSKIYYLWYCFYVTKQPGGLTGVRQHSVLDTYYTIQLIRSYAICCNEHQILSPEIPPKILLTRTVVLICNLL